MKLFKEKKKESYNILDLTPVRIRDFVLNSAKSDGTVTVLVPKFGVSKIGKWLNSFTKSKDNRANLDRIGTFIWNRCDGNASVRQIAEGLRLEFGESVEPVVERLSLFIIQMKRARFITFRELEKSAVYPTTIRS